MAKGTHISLSSCRLGILFALAGTLTLMPMQRMVPTSLCAKGLSNRLTFLISPVRSPGDKTDEPEKMAAAIDPGSASDANPTSRAASTGSPMSGREGPLDGMKRMRRFHDMALSKREKEEGEKELQPAPCFSPNRRPCVAERAGVGVEAPPSTTHTKSFGREQSISWPPYHGHAITTLH